MRRLKTFALLLAFVSIAAAQTVVYKNQRLSLPPQFTVEPHAITYLPAGARQITTLRWDDIDLAILARQEPEIEGARHQAVLTGKKVYLAVTPPIHYMRLFMELPVNVQFNRSWVATSQTRYTTSTTSFPQGTGTGQTVLATQGFVTAKTTTRIIDTTRYPLATTMEGLLMTMGDDRKPDAQRLVRELQTYGAFFPNLILGVRKLQEVYPRDHMLPRLLKALDKLSSDQAISVDAQRELQAFVAYTRKR